MYKSFHITQSAQSLKAHVKQSSQQYLYTDRCNRLVVTLCSPCPENQHGYTKEQMGRFMETSQIKNTMTGKIILTQVILFFTSLDNREAE